MLEGTAQTSVNAGDIDSAASTEWEGGRERPVPPDKDPHRAIIWTRDLRATSTGTTFGESTRPGVRHLRIGFKSPVAVGSVLVRAGGQLSVLKSDAVYPGDLSREADWLPAERIEGSKISHEEVGHDAFAVWVLPPGARTRALRFTHKAIVSDPQYGGYLGGAMILSERMANVAPQAIASASAREEAAALLVNSNDEGWNPWDNGKEGAEQPVTPEHAAWVMLTWPRPIPLNRLEAIRAGFGAAEAQIYTGPPDKLPAEAAPAEWQTLKTFANVQEGYPWAFWPQAMDLGATVTTRAVRLRLTAPTTESGHLTGKTKQGRRVWLNELMALGPLGDAELKSALLPVEAIESHPPIAVRFKLDEPGFVTLVIEDASGKRVRNLVSETPFPAGENTAWWDGTDDLGRDRDAARHGLYHVPEQPVAPGAYRVRGLFRKGLDLRYEFSIYNAGNPAWSTADTTGGWLTNHTPPQAALFVPADRGNTGQPMVYLGSAVSEGGAGLAWVDLDGRKLGGRGWIGGNWTAAPYLARDQGANAVPGVIAYVAATWTAGADNKDRTHGELRVTALTSEGDKAIVKHPFSPPGTEDGDHHWIEQLGGIAVHDGLLVASMKKLGSLVFVDARQNKEIGAAPVDNPRGAAFDAQGRLLVLSGKALLRFTLNSAAPASLPPGSALVTKDLQDPSGIALDATGRVLISDWGDSQQVKIFSPDGKFQAAIGHPGAPKAGPYDPLHMNHPHGITVDSRQQLWVAEDDYQPKRVSVWTLDGKLVHAFYGPGRYGGGGSLDPLDKTRFYYDGMEFKLDWKTGASEPAAIFYREGDDETASQFRVAPPQTPIHAEGRQYMTNCYNSNPTGGASIATIWQMKDGVAVPVAAFGRARDWELLGGEAFKPRWPAGSDLKADESRHPVTFLWSDANGDGRVQPDEVTLTSALSGGVTVGPDLSFMDSRLDGAAIRLVPRRFTDNGVPIYEFGSPQTLATAAQAPASSGGDQALVSPDGWTVLTVAPEPFAREGFAGIRDAKPIWSYPSVWPGLHASHEAPTATHLGEVIGSTRLLGDFVTPRNSDAGPLWCINGNNGALYLFTADGLYVAQLFEDSRVGKPWSMPSAQRGMLLNDVTLHEENFFPTITQTADGLVYLCDGARTSLVRIDGLETIRRLPATDLRVTPDDLQNATAWRGQVEAQRQAVRGQGTLQVAVRKQAAIADGKLDEWAGAQWATIDRRGVGAHFNSDSKPYDITGAVMIAGDRLCAAYRTADAELLKNAGDAPSAPFKTGGCLDLMVGTDPAANPSRTRPVAGDERLVVTQVQGRTLALLYRAVVPGTREPVPFSSPWRTITLDRVDDVSKQVLLSVNVEKDDKGKVKTACYAFSIPLAVLGLNPADGLSIKGDIGILRGNGFQTLQRSYWNNKATAITADVPSEAELTPGLWGRWVFKAMP